MIPLRLISVSALIVGFALAEDPLPPAAGGAPPVPPAAEAADLTWIGLQVGKPDEATRAQLPDLPPGIGFIVQSLDPQGPAETAGLKPFDVVWKFDDQWLVNEGQLATLLRLRKPGDRVTLAIFRSGRAMEVPVTLGRIKAGQLLPTGPALEIPTPGEESKMLTRIINRDARSASLQAEDGRAVLRKPTPQGGYELEIRNPADEVIFSGILPPDGGTAAVPKAWRLRVGALRRGLDGALSGQLDPVRRPRPRIIPAPPSS
jgi:hypothetical protein